MNIERLKTMLVHHEGIRLKPYTDTVGKLTIGIGRNLTDVGISEAEALYLLSNDIGTVLEDLHKYLPWHTQLPEDKQLVLADMCFNLGIAGLLKFRNFLTALQNGNFQKARIEMLNSRWASQVGNRAISLAQLINPLTDSETKDA